jgi:16S rRNA processing protein RimM
VTGAGSRRWADMALVGRVVRPQGNRGEVVVEPDTDFASERFAPGATVFIARQGEPVPIEVRSSRAHGARWVVGFAGTDTIDAAEALRGAELRLPAAELKPLESGRYYVHDLIGCRVVTDRGEDVGVVARVDVASGAPLLAVARTRGEAWVPLVEAICRRVDLANRTITIAPPPGLLDVNEG